MMKGTYVILAIIAFLLFALVAILIFFPQLSLTAVGEYCEGCNEQDAIAFAAQVGRLDIVSLSLAFLGIGVGFFAIFSFFAVRDDAVKASLDSVEEKIEDIIKSKIDTRLPDEVKNAVAKEFEEQRQETASALEETPESDDIEPAGE